MYNVSFRFHSFDLDNLARCENYLLSIFNFFNLEQIKHQVHPKKCKKITVCRSPHIDKKSREQFQLISHKKTIICRVSNKSILLLLLEILKDVKFVGIQLEFLIDYSTFSFSKRKV